MSILEQINLDVKKIFFDQIQNGSKTREIRIAFRHFTDVRRGTIIVFRCSETKKMCKKRVMKRLWYSSVENVLARPDISQCCPGMNQAEMRQMAHRMFSRERVEKCGLLVFELR